MNCRKLVVIMLIGLVLCSATLGKKKRVCEPTMATRVLLYCGTFGVTLLTVMLTGGAILAAVGFGPLGVVGGSLAASWQAILGNVTGGSIFAYLQSLGMTGVTLKSAAKVAAWVAENGTPELEKLLALDCRDVE